MQRLLIPLLAITVAACDGGRGLVAVKVTAEPPLSGAARLTGVASSAGRQIPIDIALDAEGVSIPPDHRFGLDAPAGASLRIQLTAVDKHGTALGSGEANVDVPAGARADVTVVLRPGTVRDGGVDAAPPDLGSRDLAAADGAGRIETDLPPPDLRSSDGGPAVEPDLITTDLARPAEPDLAMPDLASPDLVPRVEPDLGAPDLASPDLALLAPPDLAVRDLAADDRSVPDLDVPDAALPPDASALPVDAARVITPDSSVVYFCAADSDCPSGMGCIAPTCVPLCGTLRGCAAGLTCCGATCVDATADSANCGACGAQCTGAAICCNSGCVDPNSDSANCGACGRSCALPNATETCSSGFCIFGACIAPFANCDGILLNGCEVSTDSDPRNCGACGNTCPPGARCTGGTCGAALACLPVINELQTGSSAGPTDEFVEIYNPCGDALSLADWTIVYRSANNNAAAVSPDVVEYRFSAADSLAGGGYFVACGLAYTASCDAPLRTTGLAAGGGAVGLRDPAGNLVDGVAYRVLSIANNLGEGMPAPNPPTAAYPGNSIARIPNGIDTNNNGLDFQVSTMPTPGAANR